MAGKPGRPGAAKGKKGMRVGTGGHGKQALEGRGPTPKAEDRPYHKADKAKAAAQKHPAATGATPIRRGEFLAPAARTAGSAGAAARSGQRVAKAADASEVLSGRNSVVEALRSKVPATALFIAARIEMDDRVKESIKIAGSRGIAVNEITRPEMDRMT